MIVQQAIASARRSTSLEVQLGPIVHIYDVNARGCAGQASVHWPGWSVRR